MPDNKQEDERKAANPQVHGDDRRNEGEFKADAEQHAKERKAEEKEEEKEAKAVAKATFTTLHAVNRHGEVIPPGKEIGFEDDEVQHVRQLQEQGVIVEGKPDSKEAKLALERADRDRDRARRAHETGGRA